MPSKSCSWRGRFSEVDQAGTCFETFGAEGLEAADLFLSGDSPLPDSIDRGAELLDGSDFPEFHCSDSGGDDLMCSLCRLSHATASQPGC